MTFLGRFGNCWDEKNAHYSLSRTPLAPCHTRLVSQRVVEVHLEEGKISFFCNGLSLVFPEPDQLGFARGTILGKGILTPLKKRGSVNTVIEVLFS